MLSSSESRLLLAKFLSDQKMIDVDKEDKNDYDFDHCYLPQYVIDLLKNRYVIETPKQGCFDYLQRVNQALGIKTRYAFPVRKCPGNIDIVKTGSRYIEVHTIYQEDVPEDVWDFFGNFLIEQQIRCNLTIEDDYNVIILAWPSPSSASEEGQRLEGWVKGLIDPDYDLAYLAGICTRKEDGKSIGLGSLLLDQFIKQVRCHKMNAVRLSSVPDAIGFYLKKGFVVDLDTIAKKSDMLKNRQVKKFEMMMRGWTDIISNKDQTLQELAEKLARNLRKYAVKLHAGLPMILYLT